MGLALIQSLYVKGEVFSRKDHAKINAKIMKAFGHNIESLKKVITECIEEGLNENLVLLVAYVSEQYKGAITLNSLLKVSAYKLNYGAVEYLLSKGAVAGSEDIEWVVKQLKAFQAPDDDNAVNLIKFLQSKGAKIPPTALPTARKTCGEAKEEPKIIKYILASEAFDNIKAQLENYVSSPRLHVRRNHIPLAQDILSQLKENNLEKLVKLWDSEEVRKARSLCNPDGAFAQIDRAILESARVQGYQTEGQVVAFLSRQVHGYFSLDYKSSCSSFFTLRWRNHSDVIREFYNSLTGRENLQGFWLKWNNVAKDIKAKGYNENGAFAKLDATINDFCKHSRQNPFVNYNSNGYARTSV